MRHQDGPLVLIEVIGVLIAIGTQRVDAALQPLDGPDWIAAPFVRPSPALMAVPGEDVVDRKRMSNELG
jgi:hypothetical protein